MTISGSPSILPTHLIVEAAAAVLFLAAGLTQIYANRLWAAYYRIVSAYGEWGMRLHGAVSAAVGGLAVAGHPIWQGPGALLTFVAVLMVAEGAVCLIMPKYGLLSLEALDDSVRNRALLFTGAILIVIAGVLALNLWILVSH